METEVNSFLLDMHMDTNGTWVLPHQNVLCVLSYKEEHFQAVGEHEKGQGEAPQVTKEEEGVHKELDRKSQATPCARAPETSCPRATRGATAVAPRAHGPPRMAG